MREPFDIVLVGRAMHLAIEAHQAGCQTFVKNEGLFGVVIAGTQRVEDQR